MTAGSEKDLQKRRRAYKGARGGSVQELITHKKSPNRQEKGAAHRVFPRGKKKEAALFSFAVKAALAAKMAAKNAEKI